MTHDDKSEADHMLTKKLQLIEILEGMVEKLKKESVRVLDAEWSMNRGVDIYYDKNYLPHHRANGIEDHTVRLEIYDDEIYKREIQRAAEK